MCFQPLQFHILKISVAVSSLYLLACASFLRVVWSQGMNRIAGRKLIVSREPNSLKPSSMRSVKRWKRKSLCSNRTLIVRAQMTLLDAMARTGPRSVGAPSRRHSVFRRVSTSSCRNTEHRDKSYMRRHIYIYTRSIIKMSFLLLLFSANFERELLYNDIRNLYNNAYSKLNTTLSHAVQ